MPRYLVVPRDRPETFSGVSPREMQEIIERYHAWTMGLRESGALHLGEKLVDGEGRVLRPSTDGVSVTDGPFAEADEVIGGLWIVEARDMEDATRIASECPHASVGSLEIRRIEEIEPDGA